MKLPKLIDPCPIIEAIIEIRFESKLISDAIFGVIYNSVKETFPKTENLPILQIPENIRINDPNLKYNPYYSLLNNNFILQIGPKVVSLINKVIRQHILNRENRLFLLFFIGEHQEVIQLR